jgi:PKHD-type hydroxylase
MFLPALPARNNAVSRIHGDHIFSDKECDEIVRSAERQTPKEARIGSAGAGAVKAKVRSVLEQVLPVDPANGFPVVRILGEICRMNSGLWYFELTGFVPDDPPQLLTYRGGTGDHYDWHIDIGMENTASRKLGFTVQLSASSEYDGGDLEFHSVQVDREAFRRKGTMLVFPTYWLHRVSPLTRGTRRVIVGWVHGPSFR